MSPPTIYLESNNQFVLFPEKIHPVRSSSMEEGDVGWLQRFDQRAAERSRMMLK
jgi:hypothetical protein